MLANERFRATSPWLVNTAIWSREIVFEAPPPGSVPPRLGRPSTATPSARPGQMQAITVSRPNESRRSGQARNCRDEAHRRRLKAGLRAGVPLAPAERPARSLIPRSIFWLITKLTASTGSTRNRAHALV